MKLASLILAFVTGFAVAMAVGLLLVLPADRDAARVKVDSDVHRPMLVALQAIEQTAGAGDCAATAVQLRELRQRFAAYRDGGAPPEVWVDMVIAATTRPAE